MINFFFFERIGRHVHMNHINEPDRSIIIDAIFTSIVLGLISNLRESCCVDFATSNNNIKHPSEINYWFT